MYLLNTRIINRYGPIKIGDRLFSSSFNRKGKQPEKKKTAAEGDQQRRRPSQYPISPVASTAATQVWVCTLTGAMCGPKVRRNSRR